MRSLLAGRIAVCGIGRPSGRRNSAVTANQSARPPTRAASATARSSSKAGPGLWIIRVAANEAPASARRPVASARERRRRFACRRSTPFPPRLVKETVIFRQICYGGLPMRTTPSRRRLDGDDPGWASVLHLREPECALFGEEGLGDALLITRQSKTEARVTGISPYSAVSKPVTSGIGDGVGAGIVIPP